MTANLPRLVALSGAAGSGKTTAADYLIEHYGYHRVKFAGPLKDMLYAVGLTHNDIEGTGKQFPSDLLCGHSPRYVMQTLGTEWGRELIGADLWVNIWQRRVTAAAAVNPDARFIVDDMRFANELDCVKALGGVRITVHRPTVAGLAGDHVSETALPFDEQAKLVLNDGDLAQLHHRVLHSLLA